MSARVCRMQETTITILITALLSPLFLKIAEFVLNKSSENARNVDTKLDTMAKHIEELQRENTDAKIEIALLKAQAAQKDHQIAELQRETATLRSQLLEKDQQIANLQKEIDTLRNC